VPQVCGKSPTAKTIRLLLAADLQLLRAALAGLLSAEPDIAVVGTLSCTEPVAAAVRRSAADVAVIGVKEPHDSGVLAVREVRLRQPACGIVALTTTSATDLPNVCAQLLAYAVHAIVDKDASAAEFLTAIRAVADGRSVIPLAALTAARSVRPNPLSSREQDILSLAATGATTTQIAQQLNLTDGTVRNYLSNAMGKTGSHGRVNAIRIAQQFGWLQPR
jgi:two-component system, NarL family, response regulator DesR